MRRERQARGLTLEQVADRLGLKRSAPLSTFERSRHVPKAETLEEYAQAIGCTAADLLAGVVTEYDRLRGSTSPSALPPPAAPTPPRHAEHVLGLLDGLTEKGRALALEYLEFLVTKFPRETPQGSAVRTRQMRPPTSRKVSGTR
jgi:transcriptional regulator with XRE-family HTH domain